MSLALAALLGLLGRRRNRWRLRLYRLDEEHLYPFDNMLSPEGRRRYLRFRRQIPVRFELDPTSGQPDGINLTCPNCGAWQPVSAQFVNGALNHFGVIECPIYRAQRDGHPYPLTRCADGRYRLEHGVLCRVRLMG